MQRKLQQESEARFISRSLPSLQKKKEKRSSLLNQHMLQSTCFGTKIETGVDSKDDSGSQGQYREERREASGKVCVCVRAQAAHAYAHMPIPPVHLHTAWCNEIGSLASLDAHLEVVVVVYFFEKDCLIAKR